MSLPYIICIKHRTYENVETGEVRKECDPECIFWWPDHETDYENFSEFIPRCSASMDDHYEGSRLCPSSLCVPGRYEAIRTGEA